MQRSRLNWLTEVVEALHNLGGEASLPDIYDQITKNHLAPLSPSWKSTVRQVLQLHDPKSRYYTVKKALFTHAGRGKWGLLSSIGPDDRPPLQSLQKKKPRRSGAKPDNKDNQPKPRE
jgi:hypothetical protein